MGVGIEKFGIIEGQTICIVGVECKLLVLYSDFAYILEAN